VSASSGRAGGPTGQRKIPRRAVTGWLVLDKPFDMTSTEAVARIKRLYMAQKVGHAGTLDPLATGILPIALGEATKTVPAIQDGRKVYRFAIRWGAETETDDAEGKVVATSDVRPAREAVEAVLPAFIGEIEQVPPAFSAIRIGGERAYDLARAGETVILEPRVVTIADLRLVEHGAELTRFEMECEKGTYVRALARDLARTLGTRGHVADLRRTAVGPFGEAEAVTLDAIEAAADRDALLRPLAEALAEVPELRLDAGRAAAIRNGNPVLLTGRDAPVALEAAWASCAGQPVALGRVEKGQFCPTRVFIPG
jgi:tRNA pseudouridine55 synthase